MSKINDMAMTIEELRNAAAAINDAANWLALVLDIRLRFESFLKNMEHASCHS